MAVCLLIFLALVPVPLGSNRPLFWAVTAVAVALLGAGYSAALLVNRERLRVGFDEITLVPALFITQYFYLAIQIMPLPLFGLPMISVAPGSTLLMLIRTASYGVFFFLVLQVARNASRNAFMTKAMLAIGSLHAVAGLVMLRSGDTILGLKKWAYLGSATGTFVNRNSFATFLAFGCVAAAGLLIDALNRTQSDVRDAQSPQWQRVAIIAIAFAFMVAALVATQSRMGVLAAVCGVLVVASYGLSASRRRTLAFAGIGIVIVGGLAAIGLLNSQGLLDRLLFTDQSWSIRIALYQQVVQLIMQRPWTGFGGGSFEIVFSLVHDLPVGVDRVWDKSHNTYLALWAELGLIGGSIPIILWAAIAIRLRKALKTNRANWLALAVPLGVLTVGATHSLVDFSLEIQGVTYWFVAFTAMGLAQSLEPPTGGSRTGSAA
ncbi:MAG: O-antigen ligase family protein [Devosia sp.]